MLSGGFGGSGVRGRGGAGGGGARGRRERERANDGTRRDVRRCAQCDVADGFRVRRARDGVFQLDAPRFDRRE